MLILKLHVFYVIIKITLNVVDVKIDGSILKERSNCLLVLNSIRVLTFSLFPKIPCTQFGALIRSTWFSSPKVAHYLVKSTIYPYMEFCCHFWASTLHYYLLMLKKMQKWVFSSKLPAYHQNLGSFNLFHRFHFGKYSLNSHAYSEPCQTSKTERLAKIVPAHPLTVFANVSSYIFDERVLNTPSGTRWLLLLLLLLTSRRISSMIWSNIKTDKINKISSMTW